MKPLESLKELRNWLIFIVVCIVGLTKCLLNKVKSHKEVTKDVLIWILYAIIVLAVGAITIYYKQTLDKP